MNKLASIRKMQLTSGERPKHVRLTSPKAAFTNEVQIDLLDGVGKSVDRQLDFLVRSPNECEVDLSVLPLGVYHLRVVDTELYFIKRIILN